MDIQKAITDYLQDGTNVVENIAGILIAIGDQPLVDNINREIYRYNGGMITYGKLKDRFINILMRYKESLLQQESVEDEQKHKKKFQANHGTRQCSTRVEEKRTMSLHRALVVERFGGWVASY
jgi:hypothetical protein